MIRASNGFLILVLIVAFNPAFSVVYADDQFVKITVDGQIRYIVPATYSQKPISFVRQQLAGAMSREQYRKITFWTPTPQQSTEAEVAAHKFILECVGKTTLAFPDIEQWKGNPRAIEQAANELALVKRDYEKYVGQFVGIVIDHKKYIYCSYFFPRPVTEFSLDASKDFIPISDGGHSVWQVGYDISSKRCSELYINGPWDSDR